MARDTLSAAGLIILLLIPLTGILMPIIKQDPIKTLFFSILAQAMAIVAGTWIITKTRGVPWSKLGWRGNGNVIAIGLIAGMAVFGLIQLVGWLFAIEYGSGSANSLLAGAIQSKQPFYALPALILASGILAPLSEELFFRGVLCTGLSNSYGSTIGIMVSSAIFTVLHGDFSLAALLIFFAGTVFALLYQKSGSLLVPIIAHGVHNILTTLAAFIFCQR
ncbi:MAG: CPBP family intramembrane glutamic endopeptidase [Bacillota bacterium]|jgi:membrane protease YdiL (CAAX protease family)